jgi:lipopolysaccharide transport system permease protein
MSSYRFLFSQLVRRELRQKYKGSVLGVLWYLVNPLVMMGAYTLMFGVIFPLQKIHDFPLFLMVGLSVWTFFQTAVTAAADSLILQGSLIRKARFPREAIPAATVTVQLVTLSAVLTLVTVITLAIREKWTAWLLLVPLLIVVLYLFVLGLAFAVSVLHAYFRDVLPIIQAGLLPLFFLSPIYYNANSLGYAKLHPWVGTILNWVNPIAPFIEALRAIIFYGTGPGLARVIYMLVAAAVSLVLGRLLFTRMQGELAVML